MNTLKEHCLRRHLLMMKNAQVNGASLTDVVYSGLTAL